MQADIPAAVNIPNSIPKTSVPKKPKNCKYLRDFVLPSR